MGEVIPIERGGEYPGDDSRFSPRALEHALYRNVERHQLTADLERIQPYIDAESGDRTHLDWIIEEAIHDERYALALYVLEFRRRQIGDQWSVIKQERTELANKALEISIKASLQHDEATRSLGERMLRVIESTERTV